eukprot:3938228-Prymnesium_polylepis.1
MGVDHRRVEPPAAARAFIEKVLTRIGDLKRRRTYKRPRDDPKEAGGDAYKHDVPPPCSPDAPPAALPSE